MYRRVFRSLGVWRCFSRSEILEVAKESVILRDLMFTKNTFCVDTPEKINPRQDTNITSFLSRNYRWPYVFTNVSFVPLYQPHSQILFYLGLINLLKPAAYVMYHQFIIQKFYILPTLLFMCFVFILEQTATSVPYAINWSVFITEMKSVYSAVRTGALNKAVCASSLKVSLFQEKTITPYFIDPRQYLNLFN